MVGEIHNTFAALSHVRSLEMPYFVSEWDHPWPDPYRAESPVLYAAIGSFQGWSGFTIHTYRYGTHHPQDYIGATTINGVTYRMHYDTFNDPAKFGLFYHAALIMRRGDVKPAEQSVVVKVPEDIPLWPFKQGDDIPEYFPALALLNEVHRVGVDAPGMSSEADMEVSAGEPMIDTSAGEVLSDTGEIYRNWEKRYGWIDTPLTKAAYGFLGEVGTIQLAGLELDVETDWATIAISSLRDDPIESSDALLLTAVGRCDNSGARYSEDGKRQLDRGHAPVLIEPIEATVKLKTERQNLKVWVIADNKEAVTPLDTEYADGVLSFRIGAQPFYNRSTIYYILRV